MMLADDLALSQDKILNGEQDLMPKLFTRWSTT